MAPDQESDGRAIVEEIQVPISDEVCSLDVTDLNLQRTIAITNGVLKVDPVDNDDNSDKENISEDGIPTPGIQLHQPEDVCLEWLDEHKIGAGLANLGNSCFLNTVIQCLTYCPPLANYLLQEDHTATCKSYEFCMMCELAKHMKQAFQRSGDVIKPLCIYQNLKFIADHFQFGRQEDAHEFLRFVIENLWRASLCSHNEDQKLDPASRETTIINHIFGGYNRSQVKCLSCKKKSDKYEHFMDFILDIKHNSHSLEKALEHFIKPELLENDNAYNCPRCKKLVHAEKTFTVHRAPNVATIQLKRFDYNRSCGGKVTKHVSYPERLNLRPYMSENKDYPIFYKLNAVLVHAGQNCNSGHYFCYIRNSNGSWYLMDDARVHRVGIQEVLNQQAYVLFYLRISDENAAHFKKNSTPVMKNRSTSKNFRDRNSYSHIRSRPQRPLTLNLNKKQMSEENAQQKVENLNLSSSNVENGYANGYENHNRQNAYSNQNGREPSYRYEQRRDLCENTRRNINRASFPLTKHNSPKYSNYNRNIDHNLSNEHMCSEPRALSAPVNQAYLTNNSNFLPEMNGTVNYDSQDCGASDNNGYNINDECTQSVSNENRFNEPSQEYAQNAQYAHYRKNRFVNSAMNNSNQSQICSNKWLSNGMVSMNSHSAASNGGLYHRKSYSAPYYQNSKKNSFVTHMNGIDSQRTHGGRSYSAVYWNANRSNIWKGENDRYSYENNENFNYGKCKNSGYNVNRRWNNGYNRSDRFHYDRRNFNRQENGYNERFHGRFKTVHGKTFSTSSGSQQSMRNHPYRPIQVGNQRCSF